MKNFFTSEDFGGDFVNHHTTIKDAFGIASIANRKLEELIKSWPFVYFHEKESLIYKSPCIDFTHKARLAFIEELPKQPCKHEPEIFKSSHGYSFIGSYWESTCKHCGVKIGSPTWSEKK